MTPSVLEEVPIDSIAATFFRTFRRSGAKLPIAFLSPFVLNHQHEGWAITDKQLPTRSNILIFQTEDGRVRIEVRIQHEMVWLSLNQVVELFQRDKFVFSRHIKNMFDEGELLQDGAIA